MAEDKTSNKPLTTESVTWEQVPHSEIVKELRYWMGKKVTHIWLVPCVYTDGTPTCSGSQEFPYSNEKRREYNRAKIEMIVRGS